MLAGCQTAPVETVSPEQSDSGRVAEVAPIPELNIPEPVSEASCDCEAVVVEVEETYFHTCGQSKFVTLFLKKCDEFTLAACVEIK